MYDVEQPAEPWRLNPRETDQHVRAERGERGIVLEPRCIPDDVLILELLEKTNLANGSAGDAFVFGLESNLLERNDLVCGDVPSLVDDAVGTCMS